MESYCDGRLYFKNQPYCVHYFDDILSVPAVSYTHLVAGVEGKRVWPDFPGAVLIAQS